MMQPWYEFMKTESEPILFLYLLFLGPDYGYNISKTFQAAISDEIWDDARGRQTLKKPNLVSATLKEMGEKGLLTKKIDVDRRSYYDININVLCSPVNLDIKDECFIEYDGVTFDIIEKEDLTMIINFLREMGLNQMKFIEFLNPIKKFDYLTILGVFNEIITRFILYLTIGVHFAGLEMEGKFIYDGLTTDEMRKNLTEIYNLFNPEEREKIIDLEMKIIESNKINLEANKAKYLEKILDIGFKEDHLQHLLTSKDNSGRINMHGIILATSQNFNALISKLVYLERGIRTTPTRTRYIRKSIVGKYDIEKTP
jgi:hypothetical protein